MGIFANLSANRKINRKIEELEADVESLKKASRRLEGIDAEFSTLWGKVRTALGRIEKRAAIIEADQELEGDEADSPDDPAPEQPLSKQQQEWQRRILRERGRSA